MNQIASPTALTAKGLSFRQWQVWGIVAIAGLCAYLSVSIHFLNKDQLAVSALIEDMGVLQLDSETLPSNPQYWVVDAHRLLPSASLYAPEAVQIVKDPLAKLTHQITNGESAAVIDQIQVRQKLSWIWNELQAKNIQLVMQVSQSTHMYYLSVMLFIIALSGFVVWRMRLRGDSPIAHLLQDEALFAHVPVALSVSDGQDNLLRANEAFENLTGFSAQEMVGRSALCEESEEERIAADRMRKQLEAEGSWSGEYRVRCKDGSVHAEKVMRLSLGEDVSKPEGYLTMSMDSAHSDAEQRLMLWQAHHDNLTKLPNANLLNERLGRALQEGKRGAVISIDLDNFKKINDSLGHAGADRVLIEAAHRIAMCAREADTVARMGGDLFIIAMAEFDDIEEVERVARAAVESVAQPFAAEQGELFITASAGVTIYPDDGITTGELLQKADAARLDVKTRGGSQMNFFEEQMNTVAARRFELESHLRKAIAGQEFELHFQPVIDISKDEIYGAEALLRWHNPDIGFVSPAEFIPVAEASGIIVDIGRWVVTEVHRHLRQWQHSIPGLRVSLNVSARQLVDEAHANDLLEILGREFKDQVTVELTESALVQDESCALMFLRGLRDLQVHVALDDFGTGYSSVGYLRDYEFDVLKVDKSFIDGIDGARDLGLVASIVAMGRILGMRVVAEGVEEEDQVQRLKRIGCDYIQGYYYSKPLPANEFEAFVHAHRAPGEAIQDAS